MSNYIVVKPAYGVTLNSQKTVREHYAANKDFQVLSVVHRPGSYINKTDVEKNSTIKLEARYGKNLEKVMILP